MTLEPLGKVGSDFLHSRILAFPFNNQISIVASSQNKGILTPEGNICPPHFIIHQTRKALKVLVYFFPQDLKDPKTNSLLGLKIKELCSFSLGVSARRMFFPSLWPKVRSLHQILIVGLQRSVVGKAW